MAEPVDMIVPLLRDMRAEIAGRFDRVDNRFDAMDKRLASLEAAQESFRHALGADSLLSKLVTGEFEERIGFLERKVRELESLR